MGTFSNIQLFLPEAGEKQVQQIADFIVGMHAEKGFTPGPAAGAEKSVLISSLKGAWTGIYDEEAENAESLKKFASGLSAHFKTSALAVMVRDSQNIFVGLFQNGSLAGNIENSGGYANFFNMKSDPWKAVLRSGYFFEDLEKSWKEGELFVEDYLERISPVLGLYPDFVKKGFKTMAEQKPAAYKALHFKKVDSKASGA